MTENKSRSSKNQKPATPWAGRPQTATVKADPPERDQTTRDRSTQSRPTQDRATQSRPILDRPKRDRPSEGRGGGVQKAARPPKSPQAAPNPAVRPPKSTLPRANAFVGATISRRASDRIRNGHVWVYASDVESVRTANPGGAGSDTFLLPVADNRGLLLGTALYSPASQIALRMVSHQSVNQAEWLNILADRLKKAIARRWLLLTDETNACRLCFSEADELPGIIADKYGDLVVLQLLVKGLDSADVRATCTRILRDELSPTAIVERPDPRMRELEGLSAPSLAPLWAGDTETPSTQTPSTQAGFRLNGLEFQFDANSGQKTGAFLDQRANYAATADWAGRLGATDRALDVCTYQGGFALHLARNCRQVTGIDSSRASLEVAERNLAVNRAHLTAEVDWVEGDAFEVLREWSDAKESFDTIVLDPPAFAKTQRAVEGALRGYKELNLRALKMLRRGGLLVTCSCSQHVTWDDLQGSVASVAADAHRRVRPLERRGAALDHPVILSLPESEYLKCLVLEVE